jgi:hypothetical protein
MILRRIRSILLFVSLITIFLGGFSVFYGSVHLQAQNAYIERGIPFDHCTNAGFVQGDFDAPIGPCISAEGTNVGSLFFNCTKQKGGLGNLVTVGECTQIAGKVVPDCMSSISDWDNTIKNTDACKSALSGVCNYYWDKNAANSQININGCKTLFNNVKPNGVVTTATGVAQINKCETLTDKEKQDLKDKPFTGTNFDKVCKDSTGKIFGDCSTSGTQTNCNQSLNESANAVQNTFTQAKDTTGETASITDILIGLVLAIITLIIWIAGTIANSILWLVMTIFVFLLRINPADANWIKVAIAPWSVIQSISNLTILGAFLYVGFGYLLNIQKLKTRIDTFLTNIVIVAIVTNMTLLGTAAIVNIAQGVGDAFVGGYALVKGTGTGEKAFQTAFVGSTLVAFQEISNIRCGTVEGASGGNAKTTTATPKTTTPTTASKSGQCAQTGDAIQDNKNQIGKIASFVFEPSNGQDFEKLVREAIYLLIVIVAIFVFFRVMMIALLRSLSLWLLMVTSPFALAAYFSPDGFGLKQHAVKWAKSFFYFTIFYPAFVLGLVLTQELVAAFNTASASSANDNIGDPTGVGLGKLLAVLVAGLVAIGSLWLLANFFEKMFKTISDVAFDTLGTIGGLAIRAVGGGAGKIAGAAGRLDSRNLQNNINKLQTKFDRSSDPTEKANLQREIDSFKSAQNSRAKWGENTKAGFNRMGNFVEMLPERRNQLTDFGKSVGDKWSRDKKARLASFKEADRLRQELYFRKNPKLAKALGIDPDLDPKSKFRGVDKEEMLDNLAKDPNYYNDLVEQNIKSTFDKTLGVDTAIRRDVAQRKMLRLADKVNGDFNKLSGEARDFFIDAINQHADDDGLLSTMAGDDNTLNMMRQLMGSNRLDGKAAGKLRKTSPVFIEDPRERRQQVAALSQKERANIGGYNVADADVFQGMLDSGMKVDEIAKIYNNKGFTDLSESQARKKLSTMGLADDSRARIETTRDKQLNKGYSQTLPAFTGMTKQFAQNGAVSDGELKQTLAKLATEQFGNTEDVAAALAGSDSHAGKTADERLGVVMAQSSEARNYMRDNTQALSGLSDEAKLKEVAAAVLTAQDSYQLNEGVLFTQLKAQAKTAARTIGKADVATAATDQTSTTLKKLASESDGVIQSAMQTGSKELHRELGVDKGFNDIVEQATRSGTLQVGSNSYKLDSVANTQQGDVLRNHLQNIAVAAIAGNQVQFERAKQQAKQQFENDAEVNSLIDKEFSSIGGGLGGFDSAVQQAGEKARKDYNQKITDRANSRTDGSYGAAGRDFLGNVAETKKSDSKAIASNTIKAESNVPIGDINKLANELKGERKTNVRISPPPVTPTRPQGGGVILGPNGQPLNP